MEITSKYEEKRMALEEKIKKRESQVDEEKRLLKTEEGELREFMRTAVTELLASAEGIFHRSDIEEVVLYLGKGKLCAYKEGEWYESVSVYNPDTKQTEIAEYDQYIKLVRIGHSCQVKCRIECIYQEDYHPLDYGLATPSAYAITKEIGLDELLGYHPFESFIQPTYHNLLDFVEKNKEVLQKMDMTKLEKKEIVCLYSVREREQIEEFDSPAIGATRIVYDNIAQYDFFFSKEDAVQFIARRQADFEQMPGYKIKKEETGLLRGMLRGSKLSHPYAHDYIVYHQITEQQFGLDELPHNLETCLQDPQRRRR